MKKIQWKYSLEEIALPIERKIGAVFVLVITSIGFYSIFYAFREMFRVSTIQHLLDTWMFTAAELRFCNILYASIAIILGIGSSIEFLVNHPQFFKRSVRHRTQILNHARVLNWYFLAWALQLAAIYGLFFSSFGADLRFALYPSHAPMMVMLVIVLYLYQWHHLSKLVRLNRLKVFGGVTIAFVFLSFLLGSWKVYDNEAYYQNQLNQNPYYVLKIEKPVAKGYSYTKGLYTEFFMSNTLFGDYSDHAHLVHQSTVISYDKVDSIIRHHKRGLSEGTHKYNFTYKLDIDKDVLMRDVNALRTKLMKSGALKIGFGVARYYDTGGQRPYQREMLRSSLIDYNTIDSLYPNRFESVKQIEVTYDNEQVLINGVDYETTNIRSLIEEVVQEESRYVLVLKYHEDLPFDHYIKMYSTASDLILDFRDEYANKTFQMDFDFLEREDRLMVQEKFPKNMEDNNY